MTRPFLTPERIAALARLERRGLKQYEIAAELGCGVHTLVRHRRRLGTASKAKQHAGKCGAAKRWGGRNGKRAASAARAEG